MIKKHVKKSAAAVIICTVLLILTGASVNSEAEVICEVLNKRTDIITNVLSGNITYNEAEQQLKIIEDGSLYRKDLNALKQYINTDYDKIRDMQIINIRKTNEVCDISAYETEIVWTYSGYNCIYTERITYLVGINCREDGYKLISMEIINR